MLEWLVQLDRIDVMAIGFAIAAVIAAAGVFVIFVFGDRLNRDTLGSRRCPRCWYDMSGTESLTCSECGRVARRERQLRRPRRRRSYLALVMVMLVGAWLLWKTPWIRTNGWVAALPTTALVLASPMDSSQWHLLPGGRAELPMSTTTRELCVRIERGATWDWQTSLAIDRYLTDGARQRRLVLCRDDVIAGQPLHVRLVWPFAFDTKGDMACRARIAHTDAWSDGDLGRVVGEAGDTVEVEVQLRVDGREVWTGIGRTLDVAEKATDFMQPVRGPQYNKLIRDRISFVVNRQGTGVGGFPGVHIAESQTDGSTPGDWSVSTVIELRADGQTVATTTFVYPMQHRPAGFLANPGGPTMTPWESASPGLPEMLLDEGVEWTLRLTGDADVALRDQPRVLYWDGQVEIPVTAWQW